MCENIIGQPGRRQNGRRLRTRPPEPCRRSPPSAWPSRRSAPARRSRTVTGDCRAHRRCVGSVLQGDHRDRGDAGGHRRAGEGSPPTRRACAQRRRVHRRRLAVDGAIHATGKAPSQRHAGRAAQRLADQGVAPEALAQLRIARQALQQEFGFRAGQLTVEKCRDLLTNLFAHVSSGRPRPPSKMGRSFLSIASRARKIRERTVPTGQSIVCAISS